MCCGRVQGQDLCCGVRGKVSWQEGILSWVLEVKWEIGKSKKGDAEICRGNVRSTENVWCIQGMEKCLQHSAGRCKAGVSGVGRVLKGE